MSDELLKHAAAALARRRSRLEQGKVKRSPGRPRGDRPPPPPKPPRKLKPAFKAARYTTTKAATTEALLRLQFCWLLSAHADDVSSEWGGGVLEGRLVTPVEGFQAFLAAWPGDGCWIHKRETLAPWSPSNTHFQSAPSPGMRGLTLTFQLQGESLPLAPVANVLGITTDRLLDLKLQYFADDDVLLALFKEHYRV